MFNVFQLQVHAIVFNHRLAVDNRIGEITLNLIKKPSVPSSYNNAVGRGISK